MLDNMIHLNFITATLEEKRLFCLKFPQFVIKIQQVRQFTIRSIPFCLIHHYQNTFIFLNTVAETCS